MPANAKKVTRAQGQSRPQRSARNQQGIGKAVSTPISKKKIPQKRPGSCNLYGPIISAARLRLLWNQPDLAERANCHLKTVGNVERGITKSPDTIERFRRILQKELKDKRNEDLPWPSLADELTPLVGPLSASPLIVPSDATIGSGGGEIVENRPQILETPSKITAPTPRADGDGRVVLAEGAWPLHQALDKPYAAIAKTVETALAEGNVDVAFPEFRRSLYFSGYHELWPIRRRLSEGLLRQELGPRDEAWVRLKAVAYMDMEQGNFSRTKTEIEKAQVLYGKGGCAEGIGQCYRYRGDLFAKFGNFARACGDKVESLKYLKGVAKSESELELQFFQLHHQAEPSSAKLKRLLEIGEKLREIKSWRYWLTQLERARTLLALGETADALTVAKHVELSFRTELTMERTRAQAVALIQEIQMAA